jgi:hypothetical protein
VVPEAVRSRLVMLSQSDVSTIANRTQVDRQSEIDLMCEERVGAEGAIWIYRVVVVVVMVVVVVVVVEWVEEEEGGEQRNKRCGWQVGGTGKSIAVTLRGLRGPLRGYPNGLWGSSSRYGWCQTRDRNKVRHPHPTRKCLGLCILVGTYVLGRVDTVYSWPEEHQYLTSPTTSPRRRHLLLLLLAAEQGR